MEIDHGFYRVLAVVIIIVTIVAVIVRVKTGKRDEVPKADVSERVEINAPGPDYEEEPVTTAGEGMDKITSEKAISENGFVQVEKIMTEIADDGKDSQITYSGYYISSVDLSRLSDQTSDYTDCITADGFDVSKMKDISFADAFGFSYESCSSMNDFFEFARKASGFDADLYDASYDEEKYDLMKEESYEFNGDSSILYQMMGDMEFDSLLQSRSFYSLSSLSDGTKYPQMFTAIVQYEKDGITYTKTVYLGFTYFKDEESSSCGCSTGCEDPCDDTCSDEKCSDCCTDSPCPSCGGTDGCLDDCEGDCCRR